LKRLIVTGDDFGLAVPVNEAVEIAHREGILSTASLMVAGAAAQDAVARALRLPGLGVGLHLVLVEGTPVLPAGSLPALVDDSGELPDRLVAAGFRFLFSRAARRQLEAEIHAQFAAFQATGLVLDHVNAHNHMHLHPVVLGLILKVGRSFGMGACRIPCEAPRGSRRALRDLALRPWIALQKARLRRAGIRSNDYVFGLSDSGAMDEATLLRRLCELPEGTTEMYFHPATRRCPEIDRGMSDYRHQAELAALTSPRVRKALDALNIRPLTFADLSE
jgi:hopanoid biosynthesis associated protein HpnK